MKSSPQTAARRGSSALLWNEMLADSANLVPARFLATAAEAVQEPCTLALVLETSAHYAAFDDQEVIGLLERNLSTRPQNWTVASAAIRGLGFIGGGRAENSLGIFLSEVRSEREQADQKIALLKEKHVKLPDRVLRRRSHLIRVEEAIEASRTGAVHRVGPADGFSLIAERLLALRNGETPVTTLRKLSSRIRRQLTQRRKSASEMLLTQLVRTLDPAPHREALMLLVQNGGVRGFGFAALEKLEPVLSNEAFVALVRDAWLSPSLRGYDRSRLQRLLENRGEIGAQLIEEGFTVARRAAIKSQLLPFVVKDQPLDRQWTTLEAIYRDPGAAPKLKEAALREIRKLKLPQGAELFLEIYRNPRSPRSQATIAAQALRDLGTSVFMRVLVEEGALGKAANSARNRKVQRRLSLLRRQLGDAEVKEAFPQVIKTPKPDLSVSRVSCSGGGRLQSGFTGRVILPASSSPLVRSRKPQPRVVQPPTFGPSAQSWRNVIANRQSIACVVKYDPPRAAATRVRTYARSSIALLPDDRHRSSAVAIEAFERVSDSIGSPGERIRLGLAAGAVAEKLRHLPIEALSWN